MFRVPRSPLFSFFFFFNDTATTEIYTLSLHDALPISQVHPVFAVAWRPGALDLVSLRPGVRVGGGEVASRRAAPAAAAGHPPEHSGARLSPRARARSDVAVPDPQRGARARGHPDDLHGAGVEPRALLLQLPQGAATAAAGRGQGRGLATRPDLSTARGAGRGAGSRVERDAVHGGRLVLPHGE